MTDGVVDESTQTPCCKLGVDTADPGMCCGRCRGACVLEASNGKLTVAMQSLRLKSMSYLDALLVWKFPCLVVFGIILGKRIEITSGIHPGWKLRKRMFFASESC